MAKAKVLIFSGYGTNCERETAYCAKIAGAEEVKIAHFYEIVKEEVKIENYNFVIFPGGFLDGDRLGAAQAASVRFRFTKTKSGRSIVEEIKKLLDRGGVILGICNGFQLLVKIGLLPACMGRYLDRQVSLTYNDSARFEDRWVYLKTNLDSKCIFLKGLDRLFLPVRHGEGKLITLDPNIKNKLKEENHIALYYTDPKGTPTQKYPFNPNGSIFAAAGLTDPTGRILGLMPHPEAYNHLTNHPLWTRNNVKDPLGIEIFKNGIEFLHKNT